MGTRGDFPNREKPIPTDELLSIAKDVAARAGVRMTPLRQHVYRLLLEADEPLGAYDILSRLEGVGCPRPPTAYRALDSLEKLGLIRKLKSIAKYVALASGPSEEPLTFLVCQECGSAEPLYDSTESRALQDRARGRGFSQLDPTIELIGFCNQHPQ